MPRVCLPFVIVVFPDHTHSLFLKVFIVLIFFQILVLQEYWALMEYRILLKLVPEGVRIIALSISSHKQSQ